MSDYQIQPNKKKTLFYITYRTKKPEGGYKKNYLQNESGIVSFDSLEKADKYRKSQRANEDAKNNLKAVRERMSRKYGKQEEFLISFLKERKKEAPKSWERTEWHLIHYVFTFFLHEKKELNAGLWASHFENFKEWLEEATTIRKNKLSKDGSNTLSISSMNKIIGDLNGYLQHLFKKRHLLMTPPKCEYFDGAEEGYRSGEDVVDDEEYKLVLKKFDSMVSKKELEKSKKVISLENSKKLSRQILQIQESKQLYMVCRATGMRLSEALGLSFGDFFPRPLEDKNLNTLLLKNGLTSHSYIILKSQLGEYNEGTEKWKREPLKTKRKISFDNSRTIPIFSGQEECDSLLKSLHVETREYFHITKLGQITANEGQFLFFRNINKNIASSYLRKIYNELEPMGYKWKPIHCLRHTRSTEIISQTHDQTLVKLILGHKSRVFERYVHLESTLAKKASKDGLDSLLHFKDVSRKKTS